MRADAICTHRVSIITGHYGTGKTEFAVNLALQLAGLNHQVMVADLDIVNPYFRSRERRDLLQEAGVPRQAVLTETRSQDTMENFRCTAALLGGALGRRVLVVTSDYHLCRAVMTARRVGLRAKGRAAVLPHDGAWRTKRCRELLYTLDLIAGWQDEGRCRPRWTYALLDRLFPPKKEKADK